MAKTRDRFSDQIRRAVAEAPMTRYAICKAIDLDQAAMTRFMHDKGGLSMKTLDELADLLNLRVVVDDSGLPARSKSRTPKTTKKVQKRR